MCAPVVILEIASNRYKHQLSMRCPASTSSSSSLFSTLLPLRLDSSVWATVTTKQLAAAFVAVVAIVVAVNTANDPVDVVTFVPLVAVVACVAVVAAVAVAAVVILF